MALQYLMTVHELTELLTPVHWVWSAGIANPNQQWCALRGGFHTLGGGIDPGDLRFFWSCRDMEGYLIRG